MSKISFRRYTKLPILLDMLDRASLTLVNPRYWDDKNDSYFMQQYKKRLGLKSVLALCFAEAPETYHHWKVFSGDPSGVCIIFDKEKLLACFPPAEFEHRLVDYIPISKMEQNNSRLQDLPFIKRYPFGDEREYRIIYKDKVKISATKTVSIPIDCILKIVINPWMPKSVFTSVKTVLHNIKKGYEDIQINQTTIIENEKWKKFGD